MYMLMNEYRDMVTFSNEPIGENVFYPDAGLEWTEEALEKMPEWARAKTLKIDCATCTAKNVAMEIVKRSALRLKN